MPSRPRPFKSQLKIKPLPPEAEEYAKQYFINLVLQGFTIVSPAGSTISKTNIKEALEAWK